MVAATSRIFDLASQHGCHVCLSEKMDGISLSMVYDGAGKLVDAGTRGNGALPISSFHSFHS